jgi:two-component system, NtrC family, nitrogen regulation sensor histidine kinase NtrY
LNTLVLFSISIFLFRAYKLQQLGWLMKGRETTKIVIGSAVAFLLFSILHYPALTLQTIAHNSSINFDITSSLDFSFLRFVALSAVLLTWCTAFLLTDVLLRIVFGLAEKNGRWLLLIGALLFAGINLWEGQRFLPTLIIAFIFVTIIRYLRFSDALHRFQYKTFIYFFVALFAFALNTAIGVYFLNKEKNIDNAFRFAEGFLTDRDAFGEFLLNDLSEKIKSDAFIQARLSNPFLRKEPIQHKIRQVYLPNYFNKYDVQILLFNSQGNELLSTSPYTFSTFIQSYENETNKTDYTGLFRIKSLKEDIAQHYVLVSAVKNNNVLNGYVVVELSLKRSIPENVYPELLVDNRFRQSLRPEELSYATFVDSTLVSHAGEFNYDASFNSEWLRYVQLYKQSIVKNGYEHVAVRNDDQTVTIISAKTMSITFFLANLSFYIITGLGLLLLVILIIGLINILKKRELYYAARIQLFINLSFFIPLLIVSIVTLRMLSRSSQEQLNKTYQDRAVFLSGQLNEMQQKDLVNSKNSNQEQLLELSRVSNTELILFDSAGILLATSQPVLFENQLVAPVVNPRALMRAKQGEQNFIVADRIGDLPYFISYAKILSNSSLLAVPYYQSGKVLEKIQITAFADILNIFGIILLALLFFSYLVSQWLTFPLQFITRSLQRTSLTGTNEPLNWKANDEIGLMAQSYNEMLSNLTDSKKALERMQREEAWREIAQQVAHEIKNPLTPMKLALQRLRRSFQEDSVEPEQAKKSIESMLDQVDVLNAIATSFNSFAKLPEPSLQILDIVPLLKRMVDLYNESDTLILEAMPDQIKIMGDSKIIQGIFSNIILNSIQAKREAVNLQIRISAKRLENYWQLRIEDNGNGIDTDRVEKIFLPHFTTKQSGSGLGLAITKQHIEQLNGRIWFESESGKGTIFFVEIPQATD